jgi:phosphoesterase RecJ-like protein
MNATATDSAAVRRIVDAIAERQRFVISSHERPDGDALGSELAMAFALRHIGKQVRVVNRDPAPAPLMVFPGVTDVEVAVRIDDPGDAVIIMECGDLTRTGVEGLDRGFVINIDHHVGNTGFGALQWFDPTAAACGEMVFDLVQALGVPMSTEIAVHVYVAILTDTGSFHYSAISPKTFDIARQCVEAGVDAPAVARSVYDSNTIGRIKLFGSVLDRMEIDDTGRVATLYLDDAMLRSCGATADDSDGLINLPLTARDIRAVILFKEDGAGRWRISLRSKGSVNVNAVARLHGGGGHVNASGCSASGRLDALAALLRRQVTEQIDASNP